MTAFSLVTGTGKHEIGILFSGIMSKLESQKCLLFPNPHRWVSWTLPMDKSKNWPLAPSASSPGGGGEAAQAGGWREAAADDGPIPHVDDEKPQISPWAALFICCSIWACLTFLPKAGLKLWLLRAPFFTYVL